LPAGHAVDVVVQDHGRDPDVAPGGVNQVVAADGQGVAVAHQRDDVELGVGHLDARGEAERPPVGGVHGVEVHVHGQPPGAADARDHDHVVLGDAERVDGADQGAEHDAVPAARAQDVRELLVVPQVLMDDFVSGDVAHNATPA
jgi:hypothetical protein